MGRRTYLISLGISILFTLFILSGQWSGAEGLSKGYYMAQGIACLLLFFAGTLGIFWIRDRFGWKLRTEDGQDFMEKRGIGVKREYLFALLAILLLYLPAFLAVFPGIFGYDGPGEILQFFSDREPVTAHHPLAHELLLAGCFHLGYFLFGDYNPGLMLYSIVQSVTVAACAAYAVIWLRRRRIAFGYRVAALLFFGLNPLIQMLAYNTTKDTLYGAFFLLVFLLLLDLLETWNRRRAIGFVAAAILMCLFRNQGYYILAFVCLGIFVFLRKRGGKVCSILLISAVVGWFFMGPLISILQIPKGDPREMLSVPMQQMAAVWKADRPALPGSISAKLFRSGKKRISYGGAEGTSDGISPALSEAGEGEYQNISEGVRTDAVRSLGHYPIWGIPLPAVHEYIPGEQRLQYPAERFPEGV